MKNKENISNESLAIKVSVTTLILNTILTIFKLIAGIYGRSSAMVSDAVHSLSDTFSTFIVIIGVKIANKKPDKEHQYGHERFECVAAIILSIILLITGAAIGWAGLKKVINVNNHDLIIPSTIALLAAIISIIAKEWMYWYTYFAAKKIDSTALLADAWHHRSDAMSSVGSFIGILGAIIGFPILDSLASIVICIFILKVAVEIFISAIGKMSDKAVPEKLANEMKLAILSIDNVHYIDDFKTRLFGDKIYVDIEICIDCDLSLREAHKIAHEVEEHVEKKFPKVKHCSVHVNPCDD